MKCIYVFNKEYCSIVHIFETKKSKYKKNRRIVKSNKYSKKFIGVLRSTEERIKLSKISSFSMVLLVLFDRTNTFYTEGLKKGEEHHHIIIKMERERMNHLLVFSTKDIYFGNFRDFFACHRRLF